MLKAKERLNNFIEDMQYEEVSSESYLGTLNKVIALSKQVSLINPVVWDEWDNKELAYDVSEEEKLRRELLSKAKDDLNSLTNLLEINGVVYTTRLTTSTYVVVRGTTINNLEVLYLKLERVLGLDNNKTTLEEITRKQVGGNGGYNYRGDLNIVLDTKLNTYKDSSERIQGTAIMLEIPEELIYIHRQMDIRKLKTEVIKKERLEGLRDYTEVWTNGLQEDDVCRIHLGDVSQSIYTAKGKNGESLLMGLAPLEVLGTARHFQHKLSKYGEGLVKKDTRKIRGWRTERGVEVNQVVDKTKVQELSKEDKESVEQIIKNSLIVHDDAYFIYSSTAKRFVLHDKWSRWYKNGFTMDAVMGNNVKNSSNKFHKSNNLYITNILFNFLDAIEMTGEDKDTNKYVTMTYHTLLVYNGGGSEAGRFGLRHLKNPEPADSTVPLVKYVVEDNKVYNYTHQGFVRSNSMRGIRRAGGRFFPKPKREVSLPIQTGVYCEKDGRLFLNELYYNVEDSQLSLQEKEELQNVITKKLKNGRRPMSISKELRLQVSSYEINVRNLLEKYVPEDGFNKGLTYHPMYVEGESWDTRQVVLPLVPLSDKGVEDLSLFMESEYEVAQFSIYQDSDISTSPIYV